MTVSLRQVDPVRQEAGSGAARGLTIVPVRLRTAAQYVEAHHRHHKPPPGGLFAIGVALDRLLVGVAIVGRPVARMLDDSQTAEVTRCCTDGTRNACSALYGAAWRTARSMGYTRLITYTQAGESGASLRGTGWTIVAERRPHHGWDRPSRPRGSAAPIARTLWEASI